MADTPLRAVRIPTDLWEAVKAKARAEDRDASEVVRSLLTEWVER